ncbi:hypothetical protein [Chryseobacterium gleum]|uniref:hypothetical protein n=1 Tax=Chryseobacterium gleum TaxID=250 RepID=UPI0035E3DBD9
MHSSNPVIENTHQSTRLSPQNKNRSFSYLLPLLQQYCLLSRRYILLFSVFSLLHPETFFYYVLCSECFLLLAFFP